jgi:pimeloyl-ACP methyl ester carboxylesterase
MERMERMRKQELSCGLGSQEVSTPRLTTHLLESGPEEGVPVVFVHGCGHTPHIERPDAFRRVLIEFLP